MTASYVPIESHITPPLVLQVIYTYFTGSFAPGAATAAVEWSTMPVAFGCMAFCFAGHGIFPSIRASMQDVSKFGKVGRTFPPTAPSREVVM